jgi:phospholipase A2
LDLAQIEKQLRIDDKDLMTYPELEWDATVRRNSSIHPDEQQFIELIKCRISSQGAKPLHCFLDLPESEKVDPRNVPVVALGSSGGGYRAIYSFTAFMSTSKASAYGTVSH